MSTLGDLRKIRDLISKTWPEHSFRKRRGLLRRTKGALGYFEDEATHVQALAQYKVIHEILDREFGEMGKNWFLLPDSTPLTPDARREFDTLKNHLPFPFPR